MGMMIIRHKVRDYGHWRPLFDGHAEMQKAAGLTNPRVYHSADSNKSEIVVVFDTKDTKSAKAFAASDDLKKAMGEAGVLDTPTVYFLEFNRLKKPRLSGPEPDMNFCGRDEIGLTPSAIAAKAVAVTFGTNVLRLSDICRLDGRITSGRRPMAGKSS